VVKLILVSPPINYFSCVGSLYNKVRASILKTGLKIGKIFFCVILTGYGCHFEPVRALSPIFPGRGVGEQESLYQQLVRNYIMWTLFSHGSSSVGHLPGNL
jgi:hypothetical protein